MATVSGTFTAVGQSAVLDVPAVDEEITASLTGTWVATVRLEREISPHSNTWEVIRSDTGNYSIVIKQTRKNERYRFNTVAFTSGTVTFSVADAVLVLTEVTDPNTGALLAHYDEDGFVVDGDFDVTGTLTPSGNVAIGGTLAVTGNTTLTGDLAVDGGDITSSSGAIAFGNENLSTTGTLASGALSVTGAISDTAASTFTTGAAVGTMTLADGSITDSSAAISFGNENLSTTGTAATGALTVTGAASATTTSTATTGFIGGNMICTDNVGTTPGTVTAVEHGDGFNHLTILTVTAAVLTPNIPADAEEVGALIYTFPAGVHRVNMTHMNITAAVVGTDSGNADLGCGSTLAAGDGTTLQASTDEDFIDGQVVADMANPSVELTQAGDATIFASGDSKAFHINVASDWTGVQGSPTITGVVTIAWTFMGA